MRKNNPPGVVRSMFGAIAPYYDFLNRLLSMRQDVYWRRRLVAAMDLGQTDRVLDTACGTGDVMLEIWRQKPGARVFGIDFSTEMLGIAARKIRQAGRNPQGRLLAADALHPPFAEQSFDGISIAFGIRNITRRDLALEQFFSLLRPGGMMAVLELSTPRPGILRELYLLYFKKILPAVGGLFSQNMRAYQYLPESVLSFPRPRAFAGLMEGAGFKDVSWKGLSAGIATLYTGRRPA
ncbi:MAG: bifunctional demethylmenaquinone methyltransferase/2-methoxy-6-polyprenyl-1,4-benzoquinol methylase UbiE [Desulfobacterales bacterium]|nr:bifunctional demethylmenaquinone methyltransferase/2-methoxy-6-polyprenyl-1,4-benzoquinol methylase UbiE [Desulfobacterales bacterium]